MTTTTESDYIDLREVLHVFIDKWKLILKITLIFILLGGIVAFGTTPEYRSKSKIILRNSEGSKLPNLGSLGSLAGLAGIDLGSGGASGISPELYNELSKSLPFIIELLNKEVHFKIQDTSMSSFHYFKEVYDPGFASTIVKYTIKLPYVIKGAFSGDKEEKPITISEGIYSFSEGDFEIIEGFRERLSIDINPESSSITLATKLPDPNAAAELNNFFLTHLQQQILEHKTSKANDEIAYLNKRLLETRADYEYKAENLATFIGRNQNIVSQSIEFKLEMLKNEYNLAFEIYSSVLAQLENAKIAAKEETPIFSIIEPPSIPTEKSEPKRGITLILFTILGVFMSLIYLFIRHFYFR